MIDSAIVMQNNRYKYCIRYNGPLTNRELKKHIQLLSQTSTLLLATAENDLSARSYFKAIKVARTYH